MNLKFWEAWGSESEPDIDVELYEARLSTKETEYNDLVEEMKHKMDLYESVNNSSLSGHQRKSMWDAVFRKSMTQKSELVRAANSIKSSFLHSGILELLVQDSLAPSPTTNNVIDLTSENKVIDKILKDFQETVDIDAIANSIIDDVITYGEYYLSLKVEKGKGITRVLDNIDQQNIVPVYEGTKPSKYLLLDKASKTKQVAEVDPSSIAHFCLGSRKLRIRIEGVQGASKISEYVRVGMPFFYGVFDLVNTLSLLTSLVPASYLQKMNGTAIVGVSMPEGVDPKNAFKICRRYENLLNKTTSYDPTKGEMTVSDLITAAGKFKCIPILGEKGRMDKVDPRYEEMTDIGVFQEFKKDVFGTVGVPYNFFYGGETSKGDTLKQFARYTKKLSMIQMAIATGIKQMAHIHIRALGKEPGDMVDVQFANALISVEELDKVEFESTLMSVMGEMVEVINNVAEQGGGVINKKELSIFINERFKLLNLDKVLTFPEDEADEPAGDTDDDEPDDKGTKPPGGGAGDSEEPSTKEPTVKTAPTEKPTQDKPESAKPVAPELRDLKEGEQPE